MINRNNTKQPPPLSPHHTQLLLQVPTVQKLQHTQQASTEAHTASSKWR